VEGKETSKIKIQISNEAPGTRFQAPKKHQAPKFKLQPPAPITRRTHWSLGLGASLTFEVLMFEVSLVLGTWCLELL
jgi:hypothetical protein